MKPIYLDAAGLPTSLKHLKKAVVYLVEEVTIPADAGTWSGGTRSIYEALELATGRTASITDTFSAPWSSDRNARTIKLKPGYAILETGTFCGKPATPTIYCLPSEVFAALPAPASDLSYADKAVLYATKTLKSAYRKDELKSLGLTEHQINEAKARMQGLGYLDSRGAITAQGRNAAPDSLPRT